MKNSSSSRTNCLPKSVDVFDVGEAVILLLDRHDPIVTFFIPKYTSELTCDERDQQKLNAEFFKCLQEDLRSSPCCSFAPFGL